MRNIYSTLLFTALFLFQIQLTAQQQGFGCVAHQSTLSFNGKDNDLKLARKPSVDFLPLFGKKAIKNNRNIPLPFGIGVIGTYYDQAYIANDLKLIPDSTSLVARADTIYQNTTANEIKSQIRPNVWIFPFLNVYGIIGYSKGIISPNIVVPYIVIENIPIIDTLVVDSTFEIHDKIQYVGLTYGVGATFSMGIKSFFVMIDYNYTITDPTDLDDNLHNHTFSPKLGAFIGNNKKNTYGAIWVGAMYMYNDQRFSGKINVAEINPDLVPLLGEKATYSGTITAKQRWNMVIGGSLVINNHNHFVAEVGFIGRKQVSIGWDYRF